METWSYVLRHKDREIALREGEFLLGRSRSCAVRIDEDSVSRSHAMLSLRNGSARVRDLGSSNGVFVNGRRAEKDLVVGDGDEILLGSASLRLEINDPAVGTLTRRIETNPAPASDTVTRFLRPAAAPRPIDEVTLRSIEAEPAPKVSRRAPIRARLLAGTIDACVSGLLLLICLSPALIAAEVHSSLQEGGRADPIFWVLSLFCTGVGVSVLAIYYLGGWSGRGSTPGGRWVGLRVERLDGRLLNGTEALARMAVSLFYVLTIGLLFLVTAATDRDGRGISDRVANSRVVLEK
jgi:uncharacterized RDD family membrane protein YckC